MKVERFFTDGSMRNVYDSCDWGEYSITLRDATGQILYSQDNAEFPTHFSETARRIIASKYFRKRVPLCVIPNEYVPDIIYEGEHSFKQVVHRMVHFWAKSLMNRGIICESDYEIFYDEAAYMLIHQIFAPNSPQWFNTGLYTSYELGSANPNLYRYNPVSGTVESMDNEYRFTQGSACYVLSVADTLIGKDGITDLLKKETTLFKYGSGTGSNWSTLRAKGESLSGGGRSSGLMSFLKVSDTNASAIKSGGTTRRAAKMITLDVDHPEILDFINWKPREEAKARILAEAGYGYGIESESYSTVSGQDANLAIMCSDEFMSLVADYLETGNDAIWYTQNRTDAERQPHKVSEIWDAFTKASWDCGDPGIQFKDNINVYNTCIKEAEINASNPCSEYFFLNDTACNLASLRLTKFLVDGKFDVDAYRQAITIAQLISEATIHWGCYPNYTVAENSYKYRSSGLGFADVGTLLVKLGLPYACSDSLAIISAITSLLTCFSYKTSADIAESVGSFPEYVKNEESVRDVIAKHASCSENIQHTDKSLRFFGYSTPEFLTSYWQDTLDAVQTYGVNNAFVTCIAPTGTIAFAMDCETTSAEPYFSRVFRKDLVGGGHLDVAGASIQKFLDDHANSDDQDYVYSVIRDANEIPWQEHLAMLGAIQPFISGGISKTVNLPNSATVADISELYLTAWKMGLKSVIVYRDGSKTCQPLTTEKSNALGRENVSSNEFETRTINGKIQPIPIRIEAGGMVPAQRHETDIGGLSIYTNISKYVGTDLISEVFVSTGKESPLVNGLLITISVLISKMLQYGVPAEKISSTLRHMQFPPSGFVTGHPHIKSVQSISDMISKAIDIELGDFSGCQVKPDWWVDKEPATEYLIKGPIIYGEICPNCRQEKLVKSGTCKTCTNCGTTTGCS